MISASIGVMQNINASIHSADSIACLSLACFSSIESVTTIPKPAMEIQCGRIHVCS